jgi:hypothetical protein
MYFDVKATVPGQQKKCHKKTTTIHFLILFVIELKIIPRLRMCGATPSLYHV